MTTVTSSQAYTIAYNNLFDTGHSNPEFYSAADLPFTLSEPDTRPGYVFSGWYTDSGERVSALSEDMAGDIALTAMWEKLMLSFDANSLCVCKLPHAIHAEQGKAVIPATIPCRPGYLFVCWNVPDSGTGKTYFPGDTLFVSEKNIRLYAQWQSLGCNCNGANPD